MLRWLKLNSKIMSSYGSTDYNFEDPNYTYTTTVSSDSTYSEPKKNNFPLIVLLVVGGILLLILLFVFFFNNNNDNNNNNNNNNGSGNVELIWWGVFLDEDVVQPLIDEYESQNPNVTIKYANRWPNTDYDTASEIYRTELNNLIVQRDSVSLPDIFMVRNTWAGDYFLHTSGSPNISATYVKDNFYPAVTTDFVNNNSVQGIPLWMDTLAIIYNQNQLEQTTLTTPPTKWSPEFFSTSQKIYQASNSETAGFAAGTNNNVSFGPELYYLLMLQSGVEVVKKDELTGKYIASFGLGDNASQSLAALQFYKLFTGPSGSGWTNQYKNDSSAFLEQDVAMIVAPSYRLREILYFNDLYDLNIEIGIAQMPQFDAQSEPLINWADYWGNMVSNNRPAANIKASWEFLNWISQPEQLKKLSDNEKQFNSYYGFLYPRSDMNAELSDDQYLKVYNQALPYAKSFYMAKGDQVREQFLLLLGESNISSGKITETNENVQSLLDSAGIIE